jgi:hypothetical protein
MAPSAGAPPIQVDRPQHRLEGVGQDTVEVTATSLVNAPAHPQVLAEVDTARRGRQRAGADDGGSVQGQGALPGLRVAAIQQLGGDQLEDGVAEKLEALVVARAVGVLVRVGAVGERLQEQVAVIEGDPELALQRHQALGIAGHQEVIPSFSCT